MIVPDLCMYFSSIVTSFNIMWFYLIIGRYLGFVNTNDHMGKTNDHMGIFVTT